MTLNTAAECVENVICYIACVILSILISKFRGDYDDNLTSTHKLFYICVHFIFLNICAAIFFFLILGDA